MFIVIAGTPGHDSTGLLRLQYSAHKDVSFSATLTEDTLSRGCRVREGRSHDIRNKDIIYPNVVLYIRLSTSRYIHPR